MGRSIAHSNARKISFDYRDSLSGELWSAKSLSSPSPHHEVKSNLQNCAREQASFSSNNPGWVSNTLLLYRFNFPSMIISILRTQDLRIMIRLIQKIHASH